MAGKKAFDLYPKSSTPLLSEKLFANPSAEYRGAPFWSWNNKLDIDQLLRQITQLKEMGFGGFHIHARTGLDTEYMGDEFLACVKKCTEEAQRTGQLSWLYDEDRWPSGFAGGLVTKDVQHREKHLRWTQKSIDGGELVGRYQVFMEGAYLRKYKRLKYNQQPKPGAHLWHAYLETAAPTSWFNDQTYADTLSRAAIERFIQVTHERYKTVVGKHFGKTVPAIFTDEPHFTKKQTLKSGDDTNDVIIPFTSDFCQTYYKAYKQKLEDHLPELFIDLVDGEASQVRYRWHDHIAERFANAFGDTLGAWCGKNGIALTGHMLSEASLHGQSRAVGEVMRALRGFQLPGIDILSDKFEFMTAKQAQSIARQYGRPGVTSELYGVTNWDFDFAGHKRQGDWQAAMGVTVRVPHLAWVSMAGEAKRDYPASIGYQSPWYKKYSVVEDHFARLNTVLTRGKPRVRIGVIHPVESFWVHFGPTQQNGGEWQQQQKAFEDVANWLSHGLHDWDYLCESLLPSQCPKKQSKQFAVGEMAYDVIIAPAMRTMRSSTVKLLKQFVLAGGKVIFAGGVPTLVDGRRLKDAEIVARRCIKIPLARTELLSQLEEYAEISATAPDGQVSSTLLQQSREDGKLRHVFICNTDRDFGRDRIKIRFRGKWDLTRLDTLSGERLPAASTIDSGDTILNWDFEPHGHLLLTLSKRSKSEASAPPKVAWKESGRIADPVSVTLTEPNVLLLDQAEWQLGDGDWQAKEEVLRIDDAVRDQLKIKRRGGSIAQPWTDTEEAPLLADLRLKFVIESDVDIASPKLAMEDAATVKISLDGDEVDSSPQGWWVDEAIHTVSLPSISSGKHELVITIPFTRKTNVEWCYLLGDFGVALSGRHAKLTAPVKSLTWGDWCTQGLPFYAGNVIYHCTVRGTGSLLRAEFSKFKNPLLKASLDGSEAKCLAFAPFEFDLRAIDGEHRLDVTAFGNRINAFGPVHNTNEKITWVGPAAWRSSGAWWAYEYQLKRMGILAAPILKSPG